MYVKAIFQIGNTKRAKKNYEKYYRFYVNTQDTSLLVRKNAFQYALILREVFYLWKALSLREIF